MTARANPLEAAAAQVALTSHEPPVPDVLTAVADGLEGMTAPVLTVPHPKRPPRPGRPLRVRRRSA